MTAILADLLKRLFLHYKTSANGLAILLLTWLNDHGISLSESNAKAFTAKIIAYAVGLVMLFWKDAGKEDQGEDGGNPIIGSTIVRSILLLLVAAVPLSAWKCGNPADAERSIVGATYDAQLAFEASGKTSVAFNARGRLSLEKHKIITRKLKGASAAFNEFGQEIEKWPAIDGKNKVEVLDAATRLIGKIGVIANDGELIALDVETQSQIRRGIFIAVALANGIKIAIASVPENQSTPIGKVLLDLDTVQKVKGLTERGFSDQDVALTQDIITIWTDFTVKIKLQKGQSVDTLRDWRNRLYGELQKFFADQLAR